MYYNTYQALKQAITPEGGNIPVEWFNNQYEAGRLATSNAVLVEFEPLEINRATKLGGQTSIGIRLHVVTAVTPEVAGIEPLPAASIPDALPEQNEALAHQVSEAAEGITLPFGEKVTRALQLTGWEQVTKHNGWIVSVVSFRTKG